ncbi:uncharacterized protein LOC100679201 isoform X1 [Nasonia vitripennis]|uniref:Uncharacterized protein n=1 Tax=Nasonia vitripennis TaxID=7425 RepID=A0A7M7T7H0_NASVI|nr:uncharacterized protein LOC100679201 isoform X1 [Nasonia vitripennis]
MKSRDCALKPTYRYTFCQSFTSHHGGTRRKVAYCCNADGANCRLSPGTERIRVKCYSVLYGRASRYVPAPLDNEFQSGIYTQTPRKTGKAEMVQVQPGKNNPPRKNCQYNRAKAGKFTKSEAHTAHSTQTPSSGIAVSSPNGGLKLSKNAKRKLNKKFKKIARMYDAQADKPAIEITRATHYRLNFI